MGIRANIYKPSRGDSSGGGLSSRVEQVTIVKVLGLDPGGMAEPDESAPAVMIVPGPFETIRAVEASMEAPGEYEPLKRSGYVGPMMGGCFIYATNSPVGITPGSPVRLLDRWETPAEYEALST